MDINGLKAENDTNGHEAGDELIRGAARCIEKTIGRRGRCFRTGGDEFIVVTKMSETDARQAIKDLNAETERWKGEKTGNLHIASGYAMASDHKGLSFEKLVHEADLAMYKNKAEYYLASGHDRRNN